MSFDAIPDLLADMLQEQRNTNEVLIRLVETLAGLRTKVDGTARTAKAVIGKAAAPSTEAAVAAADETEAPAAVPAPSEPAPGIPAPLDYKVDVAPTFAKLLTAKGAPAVVALLAQFGVKKGVELTPEQLADALAAATSALAE